MPIRRRRAMGSGLPAGAPAWLAAALILGAVAVAGAAEGQKSPVPAAAAPCRIEPVGSGLVDRVVDGRTFALTDGREVRLAGIEVPDPAAGAAPPETQASADGGAATIAALAALVTGQEVVLKGAKPATDRYGRLLAEAYVTRDGTAVPVAKTLVAQGFARVAAHPGETACGTELRSAERAARVAKLGLWADPRYLSKRAEDAAGISAERGRFTLVEGKVVSVRESGGTIYVNFGRRWSQDFTVTIAKRNERMFAAAGIEPQKLSGRRVMVRGWVEARGGPWIEASTPEQIEIVADR